MLNEYWIFSKHLARSNMSKSPNKLLTAILMDTHAIEKAFSLPSTRLGFGKDKLENLINNIDFYISKYGYSQELKVPVSLIKAYVDFHKKKGFNNELINYAIKELDKIISKTGLSISNFADAGCISIKAYSDNNKHFNFEQFCNSRYSIRNFSLEDIDKETIEHAITIASKSPSACNRQGYKIHIFEGTAKDKILNIQAGASGFKETVNKAILITGNYNRYFTNEIHLPYVDASLFAMSLIYAFHSKNIASVPLTMGRSRKRLAQIHQEFNITKNEVPVLLIGIGHYNPNAAVATSKRKELNDLMHYHQI